MSTIFVVSDEFFDRMNTVRMTEQEVDQLPEQFNGRWLGQPGDWLEIEFESEKDLTLFLLRWL